ncbi:MAG: TonB-dependent receptor [Bacteroidota bacterium]
MNLVRLKYLFVLLISTVAMAVSAQTGRIAGKIIDKKTGEELIGVSVQIEGTSIGAATDFEGKFSINNVAPGTYNLIMSYISYQKKVVSKVEVKAKEVTQVNTTLEESTRELSEVVVSAELKKETASALLIQQKKNASISDGISADLIKKTPDATTGDVMKRISGTSIQDNKFAIIRGLNDRYNTAYINGAPLPSTESDRKAFSFDIFPSNMLDNMVITKTASPELPGDFAGGMITINTKDIPEKTFVSVSVGASNHSITTGNMSYGNTKGSTNFFGVDDGTRALPSNIPARLQYESADAATKYESSKLFNDKWSMDEVSSTPMKNSFQLSGGTSKKFWDKQEAGFIVSFSRSQSNRTTPVQRNRFTKSIAATENQMRQQYNDTVYKKEILTGIMFNAGWKLGNNHKISFKNAYTINTEDQTITRSGNDDLQDDQQMPLVKNRYFIYQDNRLMSNQLIGEHFFTPLKLKMKWVLNNNNIHRTMPDFKRATTRSTYDVFAAKYYKYNTEIGSNIDIIQTGRFYQDLKEDIKSGGVDFQRPVEFLTGKKLKTDVKFGTMYQIRERDFQVRAFGYKLKPITTPGNKYVRENFVTGTPDSIFNRSNLAPDTFYIDERINPQDVYKASSNLRTAYLMLDQRLFGRLRFSYGVRVESYNQKMNTFGAAGEPVTVDTTFTDWLPSANFTYELTDKINLRLSGSQTLARPEFRELAPFSFYDFNYNTVVTGNPNLVRTKIQNYDFRFELYPGESQLVSFSLFYKDFTNAIEQVNEFIGSDAALGYSSNTNASNHGFEVEVRKNFDFLDKAFGTSWIRKFSVTMNYAYIQSKVKFDNSISSTNASFGTRPLQGQSPYIINGSFQFYDPKSTVSAAIFVNQVGRRIAFVREKNGLVPDLWENPRTVVDLSISKTFYKHYEFKVGINDILAQDLIFYQDNNGNGKYDDISTNIDPKLGPTPRIDATTTDAEKSKFDNPLFKYKMGYTISVGVGVKF